MTDFTVNGKTYNDLDYSGANLFGMGNGGFRVNWAPMMNDALTDFSAKVSAAAAQVALANAAATAAQVTAGATAWVSGTYAAEANAISPSNHQTYRNKTAGSRTTDPALDPTNWVQISSVGHHEVTVHTGNGYGSTNTVIRRYTTTMVNTGTAITYADSATLGASFTINEPGLYEIYTADSNGLGVAILGVSVNSSTLPTGGIQSEPIATRLLSTTHYHGGATTVYADDSRVVRLSAGDVIRPHQQITVNNAANNQVIFSIRKVGF